MTIFLLDLLAALAALAGVLYTPSKAMKGALVVAAVVIALCSVLLASVRFVPATRAGIVTRNALGPSLSGGRIIATGGEMGVQADVPPPGWRLGYWPIIFDVDTAPLLKTQTDREIALREQITFQEQQRAAEQKKELTRTEQEAEEEKRLATASYEVQIAEQDQLKRIIRAKAEAEAIEIEASARAEAFRLVADQIGSGNAALVELLKIVGENRIEITPRVMVSGGGGGGSSSTGDQATVALIGTVLDTMVQRDAAPGARPPARASE